MNIEKFCIKFLRFGVFASLVAPLFVFPWTIYPYLYAKALYLNILVALMLPAYGVLLTMRPEFRPKKNTLIILITGFFGILIISSIFAADPHQAFWGTLERAAGTFFLLHYFILFLIAISVFRDLLSWRKLFIFSLFISVLVMGSTWWDIAMDKIFNPSAGTRTGGALANPIFYAAYLLFHIPLAIYLFFDFKKFWPRIIIGLVFLSEIISLLYTLTRGAMVGLIVSVFIGLVIFGVVRRKARKPVLFLIVLGTLSIVMLFAFKNITSSWPIVKRFVSISPRDLTATTRIEAWKIAFVGFKERPILGWGPENYYIIFNKFYKPELLRFSYYETWSDKPHNILFELLATTGVLGAFIYVAIFVFVLFKAIRKMLQGTLGAHIGIPLIMAFTGYGVQNLFGIDTVSTYLMFYILLGFATFVLFGRGEGEDQPKQGALSLKQPVALTFIITSIFSFIAIWQWAIEPAHAGYFTAKATSKNTFGESVELWNKALTLRTPWNYDAQVEYLKGATRLLQKAESGQINELRPLMSRGETAVNELLNTHPNNAYFNYLSGRFYSEWGKFEFKYFEEAEEYFYASIALSPKRQQLFYGLGNMYLLSGKTEKALQIFKDLVALDPGVDESHWFLGVALQEAGRSVEAYQEVKEAIRLGYSAVNRNEALVLAEVATKENDIIALQNIYENAIRVDPKNADWYAKLAALYLEIGLKDQVRGLVLKAIELDPTLTEEATKFLKLLDERS